MSRQILGVQIAPAEYDFAILGIVIYVIGLLMGMIVMAAVMAANG